MDYEKFLLKNNEFSKVLEFEEFNKPFSIMESKLFSNINPCYNCKYFRKTCFPCPIEIKEGDSITECIYYKTLINSKKYSCIKFNKEPIRIIEDGENFKVISTKSLKVIRVNVDSLKILENIYEKELISYNELLEYSRDENIDLEMILKFLDYLKEVGFISYE